jgi:hypothetical protein
MMQIELPTPAHPLAGLAEGTRATDRRIPPEHNRPA